MAAGFSALAGPAVSSIAGDSFEGNLLGRMAVGGVASKLGGGGLPLGRFLLRLSICITISGVKGVAAAKARGLEGEASVMATLIRLLNREAHTNSRPPGVPHLMRLHEKRLPFALQVMLWKSTSLATG